MTREEVVPSLTEERELTEARSLRVVDRSSRGTIQQSVSSQKDPEERETHAISPIPALRGSFARASLIASEQHRYGIAEEQPVSAPYPDPALYPPFPSSVLLNTETASTLQSLRSSNHSPG